MQCMIVSQVWLREWHMIQLKPIKWNKTYLAFFGENPIIFLLKFVEHSNDNNNVIINITECLFYARESFEHWIFLYSS